MAISRILVVDNSDLIRSFLKEKMERSNLEVVVAKNAFEGIIKMKNVRPDLIIIDHFVAEDKSKGDFFLEKSEYKTVANIPVIMLANEVDMDSVIRAAKYKITKFFTKPIKAEALFKAVSEITGVTIEIDKTKCIMEVNLNEDILFIEVGLGFNVDKIDSVKYKILELLQKYHKKSAKVLIMFNDIKLKGGDSANLYALLDNIILSSHATLNAIKIMTNVDEIKEMVLAHTKYSRIDLVSSAAEAMESLGEVDMHDLVNAERDSTIDGLDISADEHTRMTFTKPVVAIVDDDDAIIELVSSILSSSNYEVAEYHSGLQLIEDLKNTTPDLIFLDLMMPEMSGFEVLERFKQDNIRIPIIVFSSLSQKETVVRVLKYGIKSYIVKPIDPELIIKKAEEIINADF